MGVLVEPHARETVEVSIKYATALEHQQKTIERVKRSAGRVVPDDFEYSTISTLSTEEVQKLTEARPRTLLEASEISGVTPHGISRVLIALRAYDDAKRAEQRDADAGGKKYLKSQHSLKAQRRRMVAEATSSSATAVRGGEE